MGGIYSDAGEESESFCCFEPQYDETDALEAAAYSYAAKAKLPKPRGSHKSKTSKKRGVVKGDGNGKKHRLRSEKQAATGAPHSILWVAMLGLAVGSGIAGGVNFVKTMRSLDERPKWSFSRNLLDLGDGAQQRAEQPQNYSSPESEYAVPPMQMPGATPVSDKKVEYTMPGLSAEHDDGLKWQVHWVATSDRPL